MPTKKTKKVAATETRAPTLRLVSPELQLRLPTISAIAEEADPVVHARLFDTFGGLDWLIVAGSVRGSDYIAYGYVHGGQFPEWGTFSIRELESFLFQGICPRIERDAHFTPRRFSEVVVR